MYVNRVALRFARQEPPVLIVSRIEKKDRHRTGNHAVENRAPRGAVTRRLQAKLGAKEGFQYDRVVVVARRPRAVDDAARRLVGAVAEQEGAEVDGEKAARAPDEGEEAGAVGLEDKLLPVL